MPKRKPKTRTKGNVPDFILSALDKDTDFKGEVGAGWTDDNGESITIKLNPFVVLDPRADNLILKLFPNDYKRKAKVDKPEPDESEDEDDLEPLDLPEPKPEDDLELKTAY